MKFQIIPDRLNRGDKIGVISPSNSFSEKAFNQFNKGKSFLEELGFKVKVADHVLSCSDGYAASVEEKAADIRQMFIDTTIKAIICSQGGDTANATLPLIDWDIIRKNPKIFMGMSDNSILLNVINNKTGLVTFHGNDLVWGFGKNPSDYDKNEFADRLVNAKIGAVKQNSSWKIVRKGEAVNGKLMGGNLRCLLKLAGTDYWPDFSGAILFLESCMITAAQVHYMLEQFKQLGVFDKIKGAVIGYVYSLQTRFQSGAQMEDLLLKLTKTYSFPILKINDFGHVCPNTVLPVGARVNLDVSNLKIEILDKCVK